MKVSPLLRHAGLALACFVSLSLASALSAAPRLFVSPARIAELQTLVTTPSSHHKAAFDVMKARVDQNDWTIYDENPSDGNWAYARGWLAREAALTYLLTGDPAYATIAYNACEDMFLDPDPDGRVPDDGYGLSRAMNGMSFALVYDWAYDGLTQPQRDWIYGKLISTLDNWATFSHPNLENPDQASNWVGVCRGSEIVTMLAVGEEGNRASRYGIIKGSLATHMANAYGSKGYSQEGSGYTGYTMTFLLPAIFAAESIGDFGLTPSLQNSDTFRHIVSHLTMSYEKQTQRQLTTPEPQVLTTGVDNHGGDSMGTGWFSLAWNAIQPSQKSHYKWLYDRVMGTAAPRAEAEKYESGRAGIVWSILFYDETATETDPNTDPGFELHTFDGVRGAYLFRNRFERNNEVLVNFMGDYTTHGNAWNNAETFDLGIISHGMRFAGSPSKNGSNPDLYSTLLVDGAARASGSHTGRPVSAEGGLDGGGYVIVNGDLKYRALGLDSALRHLLVDFSPNDGDAVISTLDKLRVQDARQYTWQLNVGGSGLGSDNPIGYDEGINGLLSTEGGRPAFTLTGVNNQSDTVWLKGWVLSHPDAIVTIGDPLKVDVSGANEDIWVVMMTGKGTAPTGTTTGSGMATELVVGTTRVAYDAQEDRVFTFTDGGPIARFVTANDYGTPGTSVQFDATASADTNGGSITSYHWDFGDGNTATTATPTSSHTYTSRGDFRAVLTVTDDDGLTNKADGRIYIFDTISVNLAPASRKLLASETAGPLPRENWNTGSTLFNLINDSGSDTFASLITQSPFTVRSGAQPASAEEKVMNSSITHGSSVTYSVASLPSVFTDGGYEVTAAWNTNSAPGAIRATIGGQSFYLRDNTEIFEGAYAQSTALTAGDAVSGNNYAVFTGLGSPSFDLTVEAVEGGVAGLSGIQIRALGGSSSTPVNVPPVARFEVNRDSGPGPLLVTFDASSSYDPNGTIFRYEWDLGDGSTATGPVVSHTYSTVDSFEVELKVIDNNGVSTSAFRSISVLPREEENAVVRINFQPVYVPLIDGYLPDYGAPFGDRGNGFSYGWQSTREADTRDFNSAFSPDERYDTAVDFNEFGQQNGWSIDLPNGKYDVRLVMGGDPNVNSDNTVILNNTWLNDLDPFVTPDFDEYMITVDLLDGNLDIAIDGTTDRQLLNFIEVYPHSNQTPAASFEASPPFGVAPLAVDFDASSSIDDAPIASYSWDFGDGGSGTGVSPSHTFTAPGAYAVTLTVTDSLGVQNSRTKTIHVTDGAPVAVIEAAPTAGIPPLVVDFDGGASFDTDGGAIISYAWDFGDGGSSTERAPQHTYAADGIYAATLTVTDNDGRTAQATRDIFVSEGSEFGIRSSSQLGDAGDTESVRGTKILSDGTIVLAANIGTATPGGVTPSVVAETGATTASGGAIVHLSPDGQTVLSVVRIAAEVVDLSIDANDELYLAAGYDGLINMPTPTTFGWQRLAGQYVHRVDAGDDGQSAALVPTNIPARESDAGGGRIHHHGPDGTLLNDFSGTQNTLDLAIDTVRQSIYLTGWRQVGQMRGTPGECVNGGTPRLPVQIAYLRACGFDGTIKWHSYSWDTNTTPAEDVNACPYVDPAYPDLTPDMLNPDWLNRYLNNMADTRGTRITLGDDGQLYAGFEAAGGNHIFRWDPYDLSRSVDIVGGDLWHQFTNTGASHKTFVGKYDPATGDYVQGQHLNTVYVYENGPGANGLRMKEGDLHADEDGRIFVVGNSASGLPFTGSSLYSRQPGQVEFNPFPPEYYTGGAYLIVLSPDFKTREYVTRLTGGITHAVDARKLPGQPYHNIVFGGHDGNLSGSPEAVVPFHAVDPVQALRGGGTQDGFFTVLGGVGGQIPDIALVTSATSGRAPLTVDFNASGSSDIDGTIQSFAWNFGDGQGASGSNVSHTFSNPGIYSVSLVATDNDGYMAKKTVQIHVFPADGANPVADAGADIFTVVAAGGTVDVTLDGSASYDPDGTLQTWRWSEGGSTVATNDPQPTLSLAPGSYLFTLEVTDADAPASHTATDTVRVQVYPQGTQLLELDPESDTYVRAFDYADSNYGGVSSVQANGGSFNRPREAWFRFDLSGLEGNIIDAELQLVPVAVNSPSATFDVSRVEDDLWNEYSLKWNNRPSAGAVIGTVLPVAGEVTIIDLDDSWFKAQQTLDGVASLRIAPGDGADALASWHSKESNQPENRPVLILAVQTGDGQLPEADFGAAPESGPRPLPVDFDASASFDNTGIVSYAWDFGDGSAAGSGQAVQHTYASAGNYTVTLTVTDGSGLFDTATRLVSVNNGEPSAALSVVPVDGLQVSADASASFDVNGSIVEYAFNFGDGTSLTQAGATAPHTYAAPGTYTASVTVTDDEGYTDTAFTGVTVSDGDPVPVISADVTSGQKPLVVQFDGSGSVDYDGSIVSYTWDFDDGSPSASGATASHTFAESGRYEVSLTVTDDDGRSASVVQPIIVNIEIRGISLNFYQPGKGDGALEPADVAGAVPLANWNNANRSNTGPHVNGFAGAVDSDGVATAVSFDWADDGRNIYTTAGIDATLSPDHNMLAVYYGEIGNFTEDIVISGIPQEFQDQWYDVYVYWGGKRQDWWKGGCIEVGVVETGESYFMTDEFNGWGGTHLQATATSCEAASDGFSYVKVEALDLETFTLKVNSISGQRMGISGIQVVYNPGVPYPEARVLTPNAFAGLPVALDASASRDNGTIVSYDWDFGDGSTGAGVSPGHTYAQPGTYTVTVTVTDDFGLSASATTEVVVNPQNGGRSIGVNFGQAAYSVSEADLVGVVPRYSWNNTADGTVADLVDQAGAPTGASLVSPISTYRTLVDPASAGKRMMKSHNGVQGGTYTVNVTGLPANITANGYDVYIYLGGGRDGDPGQATYTIGTESLVVKYNAGQAWDGSHTRSYATSAAVAVPGNDYVVFEDVTGTDLVITVDVPQNGRSGMSGLQIVANATQAAIEASVLSGTLPLTVDFDASGSSGGGTLSYDWDFGDGATGAGETTSHTFTAPGVYEVVLTATATGTGAGTDSVTIEVYDPAVTPPDLSVLASASTGSAPEFIFFDATGTTGDGPITFTWDFDDGNTATGATAGNTFMANGYYRVEVEARNAGGVDREVIEILLIQPNIDPPVAAFSANPPTGPAPLAVDFDASATAGPNVETRFFWDFGDGSTAEGETVTHTFAAEGSYTVTLWASNAGGVDTATTVIEVDEAVVPGATAVSINFGPRLIDPADIAGVEPRAFWSNVSTTATVAGLLDSEGAPTTVSVTCTAGNNYTTQDTVLDTGDQKMMGSIRGTLAGGFSINVAGIPAGYQSSGYDVIVYFGGKDSSTYLAEYVIDGQARYIRDTIGTWDGTHRESAATTSGEAVVGDNYVRWNGLSDPSFSMQVTRLGAQRYGISGLQIVKGGAPPPLTAEQKRAWIEPDPDDWVVVVPSVAGYEYRMHTATSLDAPPETWTPVGDPVSGDGSELEFRISKSNYAADPRRFFVAVIAVE